MLLELKAEIRFEDEEVLAKNFKDKLGEVLGVVRPFVRW
jgi:hypothetical protein